MSDSIESVQSGLPFRCVSVKPVVNERKQDGSHDPGKNKKGKKDETTPERQTIQTDQETTVDLQGTEEKEHDKITPEENQCGKTIDIEV